MKQVFMLAILSVWMLSCNEAAETETKNDSVPVAVDSSHADSVIPLHTDTVAKIDTVPAEPVYDAFFAVWFTTSYCGGARPTDEITQQHATERPLTSSQLRLKNHFTGKEYLLKTSPAGEARTKMEAGKYDVYLTKDINAALGTGFDSKCTQWMSQPVITVKVDASGKMNKISLHFTCNPCDQMKPRP